MYGLLIILMMETIRTSETLVDSQSTWHYNPEDSHLHAIVMKTCEEVVRLKSNFMEQFLFENLTVTCVHRPHLTPCVTFYNTLGFVVRSLFRLLPNVQNGGCLIYSQLPSISGGLLSHSQFREEPHHDAKKPTCHDGTDIHSIIAK
jgi:hypothetical protein